MIGVMKMIRDNGCVRVKPQQRAKINRDIYNELDKKGLMFDGNKVEIIEVKKSTASINLHSGKYALKPNEYIEYSYEANDNGHYSCKVKRIDTMLYQEKESGSRSPLTDMMKKSVTCTEMLEDENGIIYNGRFVPHASN